MERAWVLCRLLEVLGIAAKFLHIVGNPLLLFESSNQFPSSPSYYLGAKKELTVLLASSLGPQSPNTGASSVKQDVFLLSEGMAQSLIKTLSNLDLFIPVIIPLDCTGEYKWGEMFSLRHLIEILKIRWTDMKIGMKTYLEYIDKILAESKRKIKRWKIAQEIRWGLEL